VSGLTRRRGARLAVAVILGLALGGAGFLALQILTAPGARDVDGWTLRAKMPNARGETAGAVADGRLYVIGGMTGLDFAASAEVSVFDHSTAAWDTAPFLPEARHHAAAVGLEGFVYVTGGVDPAGSRSATLWVLGPGDASWRALEPMPEGRIGHRMVALDGRVYVVGGVAGARTDSASEPAGLVDGSVLIYDPAGDLWSGGAPMPLSRDHLAVVVVEGEIWAIGGRASGVNHSRVDIYDPVADAWRAGPPLPEPTSGAAEGVVEGIIVISGGEDPVRGAIVDRHWRLDAGAMTDLATPQWLPLPIPPLAVHGALGATLDGRFVIVSGSTRPGGQSNTAWTGALQELRIAP
jgi:N-acetylneuraminic acid mutarotase